jgi:AcrR family transcriptional regulator
MMDHTRLFPYNPPSPPEPSSEERIRDAALTTFATHGIAATSLRSVAEVAGVSIGLVQHYFHTKAALVIAVDQYVLRVLSNGLESAALPEQPADALNEAGHRLTTLMAEHPVVMDYLGHAFTEDAAIGSVIFDGLVGISAAQRDQFAEQGMTRPDLDPDWAALNPLILRVGALILRPHIERYLGKPFFTDSQLRRWDAAVTDLIRDGQILGDRSVRDRVDAQFEE